MRDAHVLRRPAAAALAAAAMLAAAGCGNGGETATATTTATPGTTRLNAPLAWQRAVRPPGRPSDLRLVYVSVPGRPARRWRILDDGERHVVTLLGRPRHKQELGAAVISCVTIRASALSDGRPVVDGAGRGKPALYRELHSAVERKLAQRVSATARNCPLLRR